MISTAVIMSALELGCVYALVALALFLSFRILNIADMTTDGTFTLGCAVSATVAVAGHPFLALPAAMICGALAGSVTALLQTKLNIPSILAGILTQLMLYSVNLVTLGGKSLMMVDHRTSQLLLHMSNNPMAIVAMVAMVTVTIIVLWLFFYTEVGLTLKSTGDNPDMSRAQGVNVKRSKVIGLAIAMVVLLVVFYIMFFAAYFNIFFDIGMSFEMEKVLSAMPNGNGGFKAQRILEINPDHAIFKALEKIADKSEDLSEYADLLYNQAYHYIHHIQLQAPLQHSIPMAI